jgi:hypothetical protein
MTVLKYYAFFPFVTVLPGMCEPWIAESTLNFAMALVGIAAAHWALKAWHRARVRERCAMPAMEGEDEDSPLRLGLLG